MTFLFLSKQAGRRWYLLLSLLSPIRMTADASSYWWKIWSAHRATIGVLTMTNVGLTTFNEFVVRSATAPMTGGTSGFFSKSDSSEIPINRQSITNILMTLFASILGGPILFMPNLRRRSLYFISFGAFNSVISQLCANFLLLGLPILSLTRLGFDLAYTLFIKFGIFELFRRPLINSAQHSFRLGGLRIFQDLSTTLLRVVLMIGCGIRN